MERSGGKEKRGKNTKSGGISRDEQMVRDWSHSIPTDSPSVYRRKAEGIERKGSPTLLDGKSNVTNSEYWIGQHWNLQHIPYY